ncbi:MAG: OmpA family protein [Cryomorphaceae bacterium]|nr:OmpA family protein [Cryomorphaceae bacterium]
MNRLERTNLLVFVCMFLSHLSFAQFSSSSKKATKLFKQAQFIPTQQLDPQTGMPDFKAGIELVDKALKKDPNFWEAYVLRGEYHMNLRDKSAAIGDFENALRVSPNHSRTGMTFYRLADLYLDQGAYDKALTNIKSFINHPNANEEYLKSGYSIYDNALFAIDAIKHPKPFNPVNVGPGVNTQFAEYYPTLTVNGKELMFTRALPYGSSIQEDFFTSINRDNAWTMATPMPQHVNTEHNEGAPTISADGRSLIFVACIDETGTYGEQRKGKGSCDLFFTQKIGPRWSNPVNLPGDVNSYHWETQPSLAADGKTLYFVRGLRGKGADQRNSDIYVSKLSEQGKWGAAERLSDVINTPFAEESVCIHPDGKTLYFASRGHAGMGGSDIFMSQMDHLGNWSKPVNLGYPINTKFDENSLIVSAEGNLAFFASDRAGGYGDLDIYYFELPKEFQPTTTYYFDGRVFDAQSNNPIPGHFTLKDIASGEVIIISNADAINGTFTVPLPSNRQYVIEVTYDGYAMTSLGFDLTYNANQTSYHLDIPMNPLNSGSANILKNIYFDLNSATLRKESNIELNNLANFLRTNPNIHIELGGHTDTRGNAEDNLTLSTERAKAVYTHLIQVERIDANRLTFVGFGEREPIISDSEIAAISSETEREKAHQTNRRTVYKIIKQ